MRAGEILGIAGVSGNGQRELAEVITGLRPTTRGMIKIGGARLPTGDPRGAIDLGIAYVPEDRMGTGIAPNLSIAENLMLKSYRAKTMRSGPVLSSRKAIANAKRDDRAFRCSRPGAAHVDQAALRWEHPKGPPGPRALVTAAGAGGRLADTRPRRGRHSVREARSPDTATSGVAVVMISEDLDEVFELSDRIAVFYNGRVVGTLKASEADRQQIGLMMAGAA